MCPSPSKCNCKRIQELSGTEVCSDYQEIKVKRADVDDEHRVGGHNLRGHLRLGLLRLRSSGFCLMRLCGSRERECDRGVYWDVFTCALR